MGVWLILLGITGMGVSAAVVVRRGMSYSGAEGALFVVSLAFTIIGLCVVL